jgi:hypothetical protein
MMARVLSLVGVPRGKIPALRLEKYNPSAALLNHCNDYCRNSAFWKTCLPKVRRKNKENLHKNTLRGFFSTDDKYKRYQNTRLVGRMRPGSFFIRSSHWSDIPIIVRAWLGAKKLFAFKPNMLFHYEPKCSKRSAILGWQRTTNVSRQCQNMRSFQFQWLSTYLILSLKIRTLLNSVFNCIENKFFVV